MSPTDSDKDFYHPVRIGRIIGSLETAIQTYNHVHKKPGSSDLVSVPSTDPLRQILSAAMGDYKTMLTDFPDSSNSVPHYLHQKYEQMDRLFNNQDK